MCGPHEARNAQRVFGFVPSLVPGLATVAQGDVMAETGAQVLTQGPVAQLDRAGIVTVTMRSNMP